MIDGISDANTMSPVVRTCDGGGGDGVGTVEEMELGGAEDFEVLAVVDEGGGGIGQHPKSNIISKFAKKFSGEHSPGIKIKDSKNPTQFPPPELNIVKLIPPGTH